MRPLPGARELLAHLSAVGVPWAVATTGYRESAPGGRRVLRSHEFQFGLDLILDGLERVLETA